MVLSKEWNPEQAISKLEQEWKEATIPKNGIVTPEEAAKYQLIYQGYSDSLGDAVAQALYYEEICKFERDNAYTIAFLHSAKESDRQRDIDAKNDPNVRIAETKLFKAKSYRRLLENKHESTIRSHHAYKSLMKSNDQKWTM